MDDEICAGLAFTIYALNGRMDKIIVVLGTVALATLALAIARQLSEKTC